MITCQTAKDLIEQFIDGTIDDAGLEQLRAHAETCEACREELHRCHLMQEIITESLSGQTAATQARTQVMARLPEGRRPERAINRPIWIRTAIAAGILLAIGLSVGFILGRTESVRPDEPPLAVEVPMRISDIEGTVLVKHEGADIWQTLKDSANVRLGDTFHSAAGSAFVLALNDKKSTIKVSQNSMMALISYGGEMRFFLEHGECTANLESPHGPFFISTPHGRVEALGTEFTVTVE